MLIGIYGLSTLRGSAGLLHNHFAVGGVIFSDTPQLTGVDTVLIGVAEVHGVVQ